MEPVDTEGAGLKVESYREFPEVVDFNLRYILGTQDVVSWQISGGTEVTGGPQWPNGPTSKDFQGAHGQGQDQQDRVGHLISWPFSLPPFEVWKSNCGTPQKKQP